MGSPRRRSCRQHTAARQAAGTPHCRSRAGSLPPARGRRGATEDQDHRVPFTPSGPSQIPNKAGQPGFRLIQATARLGPSAAGYALRAASTAHGKTPAHGGQDGPGREARRGAEVRDRGGAMQRGQPRLPVGTGHERLLPQRRRPRLGARPSGRSTAAPPAAAVAACGAPSGAGTCVQAAHPGKHPSHLK